MELGASDSSPSKAVPGTEQGVLRLGLAGKRLQHAISAGAAVPSGSPPAPCPWPLDDSKGRVKLCILRGLACGCLSPGEGAGADTELQIKWGLTEIWGDRGGSCGRKLRINW